MISDRNRKIALTGMFGALSILLAITPLGYIQLAGVINITIIHVPVILATILAGPVAGVIDGFIFGTTSCIRAALMSAPTSYMFRNPLVSILPRMLFPLFVWLVYWGLSKLPKMPKVISGAVSAAFGTFMHTFLVMGMITILYGQDFVKLIQAGLAKFGFEASISGFKAFLGIMIVTIGTNGIWEIIGATVIVTAVLSAIFVSKNGKSKLSKSE